MGLINKDPQFTFFIVVDRTGYVAGAFDSWKAAEYFLKEVLPEEVQSDFFICQRSLQSYVDKQ